MKDTVYWLSKPGNEVAKELLQRVRRYYERGPQYSPAGMGFDVRKIEKLYYAYYGNSAANSSDGLRATGDNGELTTTYANHIKAIVKTILSMVAGERIAFKVKAANTDSASIQQAMLAQGLLSGYVDRLKMAKMLYEATEAALVTSEGWLVTTWDHYAGSIAYMTPEGQPVYEGDPRLRVFSAMNVIRDPEARNGDFGWVCVVEWVNKWDLAVTYPEHAEKILSIGSKGNRDLYLDLFGFGTMAFYNATGYSPDRVPKFTLWAKRSPAVPDGVEMECLEDGTCLIKTPLPYEGIPAHRIVCSSVMGSGYGYSDIFDLLGISEFYNQSLNTILSNQAATGVQLIGVPRGSGLTEADFKHGLSLVEFNPGMEPRALSLTGTSPEIFTSLEMSARLMDQLVGLNAASRGDVPDRMPASAIALQDNKSLRFQSPLQQAYVDVCETAAQFIVNMLRDFATTPRAREYAGKFGQNFLRHFSSEDISGAGAVQVDMDNPANNTPAANQAKADALLQNGLIKNKEEYFSILATGKMDTVMEGPMSEVLLIKSENERLAVGESLFVISVDNHVLHIQEHKVVLNSPEARMMPNVVKAVTDHIQEHVNQLEAMSQQNPTLMQALGINLQAQVQQGAAVARGTPDDGKAAEAAGMSPGSGAPDGAGGPPT